jgi:hypothetical protein
MIKLKNILNESFGNLIPNVGTIDDFKLKSLLMKNKSVLDVLGNSEKSFMKRSDVDVIGVSGKNYDFIFTDGKQEFEIGGKERKLKRPLRKARPEIVKHYSTNESKSQLNEIDLGWITIFINIFALIFYYTWGNKFSAKEWFQIIKGNIKDVYKDRELQQIMGKLAKDQEFMKYVRGEMKGPRGGKQTGEKYTQALKQRLSKEEMKYLWSFGQSTMKDYVKNNKQESVINEVEFTNQTGIKSSLARSSEFQKSVGDSKVIRWVLDKSVKLFNWVNHGLIFTDGKQEMIVQGGKPFKVLVPLQPARNQFKSLYNNKIENVNEDKLSDFEQMLKSHDWSYEFSDDHSKYMRGSKQRAELMKMKKELGSKGDTLWNKYKRR